MKEFISELEKIMPATELKFEPTPAFGQYKKFLDHAVTHPAKMNTKLLEFLISNFTREGDTILDPMAGSGSTGVVAALYNRNAVCIDIEEKFYGWMEEARKKVEKTPTLTPKGKIINICGDARRLSELLGVQSDVAITSPPFGSSTLAEGLRGRDLSKQKDFLQKHHYDYGEVGSKGNPDNIGYLPLGEVSAIITSPPYSDAISKQGGPTGVVNVGISTITAREYSSNPKNIGNLPHGQIDSIITSPPYADGKKAGEVKPEEVEKYAKRWEENVEKLGWNSWGKNFHTPGRLRSIRSLRDGYSESKENIGNLPFGKVDCCITSPPYENQLHDSHEERVGWKGCEIDKRKNLPVGYSPNPENIGNLKSRDEEYEALAKGLMRKGKPTYLSEMLKVYAEMFRVLKPGGIAIIVVKPFVRRKHVVDLPYHTWLLMTEVGFRLTKLYKLRLKQISFWRILFYKKHPEVPMVKHEYILVLQKPVGGYN